MKKTDAEKETETFLIIKDKPLILKLRSLGAGVEEADETKITFLEAAYFAEKGVLPMDKDDLIKKAKHLDKLAEEKFFVMKYLRDRGYIVRPSLDGTPYLRLHRKGFRPGEDKTYYLIEVVTEGWSSSAENLMPSLETAGRLRKELAIAVVTKGQDKPLFIKFGRMNFD
jgi:tRNA splicing endonuclease